MASLQLGLAMYEIQAHDSDAQKQRRPPELAAGRAIGCFGLSEPGFGSNAGGMITQARLLALRLGRLKDEGRLQYFMVSLAKCNNVDAALQIARATRPTR